MFKVNKIKKKLFQMLHLFDQKYSKNVKYHYNNLK